MKNLKKLSVVFMIATLFSTSFTSCIDNEVSPVVEAIYESQADLLAAQAAVLAAEAALLEAQATVAEAQAAVLLAAAEDASQLIAGQLAKLLAEAAFIDAEATKILAEAGFIDAQAQSVADITAAEVAAMAAMTDAQVVVLLAQAGLIDAQAAALADTTAADIANGAMLTEAQVAMIMSQAAINDATAAQILEMVERIKIENEGLMADNEFKALKREQELRELIAETDKNVAALQNEMMKAQLQFDKQMMKLEAELAAQGAEIAADLADEYRRAMDDVQHEEAKLAEKEAKLAKLKLMLKGNVTWEFYLDQLEGELADLEADKAAKEMAIVELEAYLADPSTPEATVSAYEAEIAALEEANAALDVEKAEAELVIADLYVEWLHYDAINNAYNEAKARRDYNQGMWDGQKAIYDAAMDEIERLEGLIADYPGAVAAAEQAIIDAELAAAAAAADTAAARTAVDDQMLLIDGLLAIYLEKVSETIVAKDSLDNYQSDFNDLTITYNNAATALTNAIDAKASNDLAGQLAAAELAQVAAANAVTLAQAKYEAEKLVYEADPTGDTWFDGTDSYGNPVFQNPNIGDNDGAVAYAEVLTWQVYSGDTDPNKWEPATWSTTYLDAIPADGAPGVLDVYIDWSNKFSTDPYVWTATKDDANRTFYIEVGTDDFSETNLYLFNVATNELGSDRFEDRSYFNNNGNVRPDLTPSSVGGAAGYDSTPDPTTGEPNGALDMLTAYAVLWNANKLVADLEKQILEEDANLADLQAEFDYQQELFDNGVANLAAYQATYDQAVLDEAAALAIHDAAVDALGTPEWVWMGPDVATSFYRPNGEQRNWVENAELIAPSTSLQDDMYNAYLMLVWANDAVVAAEDALTALMACDIACMEALIVIEEAIAAEAMIYMDEYEILVNQAQSDMDELQDAYDANMESPLQAQNLADIYEAWDVVNAIEHQQAANTYMMYQYMWLIQAIGTGGIDTIQAEIDACWAAIDVLDKDIEKKEVQIAEGEVDVMDIELEIAYREGEIEDLQMEIAAYQAVADKWYELLQEALGS